MADNQTSASIESYIGNLVIVFNRVKPYVLMIGLQFGAAGTYSTSMSTLSHGMSRYVLVVYRNAIAALVLAPFALIFDRLAYLGMQYTSASFTSPIMNAVPSVRADKDEGDTEKNKGNWNNCDVLGALVMTLYKGHVVDLIFWSSNTKSTHHSTTTNSSSKRWVAGMLFILIGCVAWSCFYVLQGIVSSGITYYGQVLVMKTRDPVFVTAFNPLCMVIVATLAAIILAEKIHLGGIIGGIIIKIGLYAVVWGKNKDYSNSQLSSSLSSSSSSPPLSRALKEDAPEQKLPLGEINIINGSKVVIAINKSDKQYSGKQHMFP